MCQRRHRAFNLNHVAFFVQRDQLATAGRQRHALLDLDIHITAKLRELFQLLVGGDAEALQQKWRAQPRAIEFDHLHADGQFVYP